MRLARRVDCLRPYRFRNASLRHVSTRDCIVIYVCRSDSVPNDSNVWRRRRNVHLGRHCWCRSIMASSIKALTTTCLTIQSSRRGFATRLISGVRPHESSTNESKKSSAHSHPALARIARRNCFNSLVPQPGHLPLVGCICSASANGVASALGQAVCCSSGNLCTLRRLHRTLAISRQAKGRVACGLTNQSSRRGFATRLISGVRPKTFMSPVWEQYVSPFRAAVVMAAIGFFFVVVFTTGALAPQGWMGWHRLFREGVPAQGAVVSCRKVGRGRWSDFTFIADGQS